MAVVGARVTVAATATALVVADPLDQGGVVCAIKNPTGGVTVDLGGSAVTTGTGFALAGGESASVDLQGGESLYAITASGTQVIHVLKSSA
jgi:hypothetical protein